jgi:DNA-binding response OmpR family regulator
MQLKDASILVVDDEPLLLKFVGDWFKSVAGKVFVAGDGVQAMKVLSQNAIDLIVTDVRMPVMNGISLLKEVKANRGNKVHVIFITGFADIEPCEAYDLGIEAILEKPFEFDDLLNAAKRSLAERDEIWQTPRDLAAYPTLTGSFASLTQALQEHRIMFGSGGFCVETKQRLVEGPVNIKLDFKAEQYSLSGQGIVRWLVNESNQVGVELTYVNNESRVRVLQLTEPAVCFIPNAARTLSLGG